jgi:hypothetical protein
MRVQKDVISSIIIVWTQWIYSDAYVVPSRLLFVSKVPSKRRKTAYQHLDGLYLTRPSFTSTQYVESISSKSCYFEKNTNNIHPMKRKITRLSYSNNKEPKLSTDTIGEKMSDGISLIFISFLIISFNLYFNTTTSLIFDGVFITCQIFMDQVEKIDDEDDDDKRPLSIYNESNEWTISKPVRNALLFFGSVFSSLLLSPMGFEVRTNELISLEPSIINGNLCSVICVGTLSVISIYFLFSMKENASTESNRNDTWDKDDMVDVLNKEQLERWDDALKRTITTTKDSNED